MICIKCGAQIDNDSVFCSECGEPIEMDYCRCAGCGARLDDDSLYCSECGCPVDNKREYCSECGHPLEEDSLFCQNCGAAINSVNNLQDPNVSQNNAASRSESVNGVADECCNFFKNFVLSLFSIVQHRKKSIVRIIIDLIAIVIFVNVVINVGNKLSCLYVVGSVKSSYLENYSTKYTIGETFDSFFNDVEWDAFISETGDWAVNAKGQYGSGEYKNTAEIQFMVEDDLKHFSVYAMEINGQPQNQLVIIMFLNNIYNNIS